MCSISEKDTQTDMNLDFRDFLKKVPIDSDNEEEKNEYY